MAFCNQCGNKLEDGKKFCPVCGAMVKEETTINNINRTSFNRGRSSNSNVPSQEDIKNNKVMAVLAYIIFLIPLFAAKESRFARYHTNQGIVLLIAEIVSKIILNIFEKILFAISLEAGLLLGSPIGIVVNIFFIVLWIIGIIHACKGEMKALPLIGGITIVK